MSSNVLVLDPGSSSLKFGLFSYDGVMDTSGYTEVPNANPALLASGIIDRLGSREAALKLEVDGLQSHSENIGAGSMSASMEFALERLRAANLALSDTLAGIGCRVVHGGDRFVETTRVTPTVIEALRGLAPLAPLHNPAAADLMDACLRLLPDVPLFAVLDTTFHRTMPDVARTYALPFSLCEQHGLHRFGFHGIAHQYVSSCLLEKIELVGTESRCITCHLGNGASICAVRNGQSIDTSMGMTPLEGLVMGTRSGDVDPGLLLYLLRTVGTSPEELDDLLNHKSGMLGVSGLSSDVRDLETASTSGDPRATLALELFSYRAAKTIGGYTAALEGLNAVAFSGGIGEHSASMRARICRRLECLGIKLDADLNDAVEPGKPTCISAKGNPVQVWVIPANEELQIAREVMSELSAIGTRV